MMLCEKSFFEGPDCKSALAHLLIIKQLAESV